MILTEEQARKKQCRICGPIPIFGPVVGSEPKPGFAACVASNCCHWRWDDTDQTSGYCGVAGVPTAHVKLSS